MKIINIVPGFGGTFYCGNCLRDSVYVKTLKAEGHEGLTLPVYLPLSIENCDNDDGLPVFYGAVNIYLKQNFRLFRNMPHWLERFFNANFLLKFAAKKAGSTRASGLENMTISMLQGMQGNQREELNELITYLEEHEKPDIIHLSNALLMGMAAEMKRRLKIPVVCSLQDEDVWIDAMEPPRRKELWDLLSEKAADVDLFVAVSNYFAGVMKEKMQIPDNKLHVAHIGVDAHLYTKNKPIHNPPVLGYLSRMNAENGFEIFIDAFLALKKLPEFAHAKARVSGGYTDDDKPFMRKQFKKLKNAGIYDDLELVEHFAGDDLHNFFKGLTLLSVPVLLGEAFGLYQLEAMASGIPVVQPALGAFPEIAELSGGSYIYETNTPQVLSEAWSKLLHNPEILNQLSLNGRKACENLFSNHQLAQKMILLYQNISQKQTAHAS